MPYQPWAAAKRLDHLANFHTPTKWADLDPEDRCLLNGVPRSNYRGTMQILQSPGYVTILYEWNHAYRAIPLDGRPHAPAAVEAVERRLARAVGGQHAGRRRDQFPC